MFAVNTKIVDLTTNAIDKMLCIFNEYFLTVVKLSLLDIKFKKMR